MDPINAKKALRSALPAIVCWYRANRRSVPWRVGPSPYKTWISEIMLQQTRISAVIPYYERFLAEVPDAAALASLSDERLMKLWEGLGYYSRARNLKRAAVEICEKHGGTLPPSYEALRALPGIGDYTAGAIASIAFGLPCPAVDGNVLRVVMRYLGAFDDIAKASIKAEVTQVLSALYPTGKDASDLTEGLMEVGEVACLPSGEPLCEECPLKDGCRARQEGLIDQLPVKAPKKPRAVEDRAVFILRCGDRYGLRRRPENGLLAGMWELPSLPLEEDFSLSRAIAALGVAATEAEAIEDAVHVFSHVEWHMRGFAVECREEAGDLVWVTAEQIREEYAIPSAFRTYRKRILAPDA